MAYNADELEGKIDGCRLHRNWGAVVKYIEKYAHVFAVGVGQHSRQHADIKGVRAYYWTVMAEILLEKKRDYIKAFGCIKKASEIQNDYVDWRVILVRMLLDQIMPNNKAASSTQSAVVIGEKDVLDDGTSTGDTISMCDNLSIADPMEYDPVVMLEDVFHSLTSNEKKLLLSILSNTSGLQRNALLAAMNILPQDAGVSICTELLRFSQTASNSNSYPSRHVAADRSKNATSPAFLAELLHRWVLLVCNQIMAPVTAQNVLTKYFSGALSEYRLWLTIDTVYCRSVICELLGDVGASRNVLINLLRNIMSTPELNEKSILNVPVSVMNLCTLASCRLPLLEYQSGLKEEAVASLRRLINPDFALKPFIPITTYAGILVESALLTLSLLSGRGSHAASGRYEWNADFAAAFDQLQEARHLVTFATSYKCAYLGTSGKYKATHGDPGVGVAVGGVPKKSPKDGYTVPAMRVGVSGTSSASAAAASPQKYRFLSMNSIAPETLSVLFRLPNVYSNPSTLAESGSAVLIGSVLSALRVQFHPRLGSDPAEPLEWGIASEVEPPVHALWNLASAYIRDHKYTPVVNLCEQCHDVLDARLINPADTAEDGNKIRSTSSGSTAVTVDRQSTTLVSDVYIGSVIRSFWEEYTETVPMHAPMNRMAHVLVDVYEDYSAAQARVFRGLLTVFAPTRYPCIAHEVIQLVDARENLDDSATGTVSVETVRSKDDRSTLASYIHLLGMINARWARDSHYCSNEHVAGQYRQAAVRCFALLFKDPACNVRNVALEYIVVLAESGALELATAVARDQISRHPEHLQFKHVLSLLLASGESTDSNGNIKTALSLCAAALAQTHAYPCAGGEAEDTLNSGEDSNTISLNYYDLVRHLSIQLSIAYLKTASGIPEMPGSEAPADPLSAVVRSLQQIAHVATTYCVPFVLRLTNAPGESDAVDDTTEGTPVIVDVPQEVVGDIMLQPAAPTGARGAPLGPRADTGAAAGAGTAAMAPSGDYCVVDFTCSYLGPVVDCSLTARCRGTTAAGSLRRDKRVLVQLLLDVVKLYLQLECFTCAKDTLEQAWVLLYSNTVDAHVSVETYSTDYQRVKEGMRSSGYLHSSSLANSAVTTEMLSTFSEFECLEHLRHVPTLFGWRLADGTGHHLSTSSDGNSYCTDLEAETIYLCSQAIFLSHRGMQHYEGIAAYGQVLNQCRELSMVALSLHPNHVPSLLFMVELSLEELLETPSGSALGSSSTSVLKYADVVSPDSTDTAEDVFVFNPRANRTVLLAKIAMYLQQALEVISRYNNTLGVSLHPEAFYAYYLAGRVEETNGCAKQALEAFVKAMQCQQYSSRRAFSNSLV